MLWYSLEAPRRGASNEYPQHMFLWRNKKNIMWIPPLVCRYVAYLYETTGRVLSPVLALIMASVLAHTNVKILLK